MYLDSMLEGFLYFLGKGVSFSCTEKSYVPSHLSKYPTSPLLMTWICPCVCGYHLTYSYCKHDPIKLYIDLPHKSTIYSAVQ